MAQLFNITHDADNLDEYDSTVTGGGDLSTGTPGLADTAAKMEVFIDDTGEIYGQVTIGTALAHLRVRHYIDPNTLTMDNDTSFAVVSACGAIEDELAETLFRWKDGSFQLRHTGKDDGGAWKNTSVFDITDEPHYVEWHVVRASSSGAKDGTVDLWIDGVLKDQLTDIDNYDQMGNVAWIRMGAARSLDSGTSGTLYLDELKGNDDGSEIGPLVPPTLAGFASVF